MTACKRCHGEGFAECRCVTEASERKPSTEWVDKGRGRHELIGANANRLIAIVDEYDDDSVTWQVMMYVAGSYVSSRSHAAPSVEAAQLAAEDALLAIAAEIVAAVRR